MTNELVLHKISVSQMDNNCYLLAANGNGLLIDAADNAPALLKMAQDAGVKITKVLTTHRHSDHVRALEDILDATGATHYAPFLEVPALPATVDVELHHGDVIEFEGFKLPIIILRGHTPGGATLVAEIDGKTNLFVGDSLFPGGLGKTSSEGDFVRLFNDVKQRLFETYPDDSIIWPGHGKETTLGQERPELEAWWERRW
ncbi:MBL fold metallo-hydrolase [Corynebacterium callunae]|uniref:MBL fold metallo-hydrolase n=1 Tax=Corynebacterium callunae TaxID=1721 RepID=UPI0020001990|nr:MBL fold metallo-hydrolase [Corynebacterium callunae]MCK2201539.1 MBL fold metallo-hydrolase [Corynebacterium callunae]